MRLWPALAVCVTIAAFVIGPLLTTLPLREYFLKGDRFGTPLGYVLHNAIFDIRPFLPGVFEHTPVRLYVNGSLWTIPVEASLYLCVAGFGLLRLFRFPWLTSVVIFAIFLVLVLRPMYLGGAKFPWYGYIHAGFFGAGVRRRSTIAQPA